MTISSLGTVTILLLFLLTLATATMGALGAHQRSERLVDGAVAGMHAIFGLAAFSSALLVYAFLAGDYSIQYVQHNGHPAMPLFYKITAFWGSLDGSLLFWVFLLSLFSSLAIRANAKRHRELIPHAVMVLAIILGFFTALLVFLKHPFKPFLITDADMPAPQGKGMNPLLQNPYMICHPPSLYLGLVSLAVPYAFAMAAMITGNVDAQWQRSMRRWVLFGWLFLSIGLVLGGLWAYEELGWGGYWAWDPVENAGLFPWLTCTAFLHSVMVQERRGMLKVWNLLLIIATFWLTIFGTFLTRSGVVQSVHAFGEDPQLAWTFGVFMVVILVVSLGLLVWRLPLLRARNELESVLSREFAFLLNNWLFLLAAFFVAGATIYPTLRDWTGMLAIEHEWIRDMTFAIDMFDKEEWLANTAAGRPPYDRVTLGPAFYNKYMVPLGLALVFLTGFGPLIAWRKSSTDSLVKQFLAPLVFGAITGVTAFFWVKSAHQVPMGVAGTTCFSLCGFTFWTIVQEFYRGVAVRRRNRPQSVLDALIGLVTKARRRYGGYIVHLGVVLMFFGWAGNAYGVERKLSMHKGDVAELGPYEVRHDGATASEDWQKDMLSVTFTVLHDGEVVDTLTPAKWWYYQSPQMPTTEVSRHMTVGGDAYISIDDVELTGRQWTRVNLYYNPLVNWVWVGFGIMIFGGIVCIGTRKTEGAA
jgi:cytochrome c-type biogenesis protein CcmF